jgi:hypothetical protein
MTGRIGDKLMIIPRQSHEPVREGEIREVRNEPYGLVYRVHWSSLKDRGRSSPCWGW